MAAPGRRMAGAPDGSRRARARPVLTRNQVIRHPQVAALGLVVETEHPRAGRLRQTRPAARFSHTPAESAAAPRRSASIREEILAELGYSAAEIAELRSENSR